MRPEARRPIDEIARCAGGGVGTVYRHFPTKEALLDGIGLATEHLCGGASLRRRGLAIIRDGLHHAGDLLPGPPPSLNGLQAHHDHRGHR